MPRTTENIQITESSLRVESSLGARELIVMEDIEGAMLFSVFGRVAVGSEIDATPIASTAFERDTWKYDITDWMQRVASLGVSIDPQEAANEVFGIIDLQDTHQGEKTEISNLRSRQRRLDTDTGQHNERVARASAYMESAVEEYGTDAIDSDPELRARILEEAAAVVAASDEEISRMISELGTEIEAREAKLDDGLGAQLAAFETSGDTAIKKLIQPTRALVRLGLITPGDSYEGLLMNDVSFNSYGPNGQKLLIKIPANLNGVTIPLSYADALKLAEHAHKEASTKKSIWG